MRLAARRAARELSKALDDPSSTDWVATAKRCLLLLQTPPRKARRARGTIKGAKPISEKELDSMCRAIIFERDKHKCRRCQKERNLQWSHVHTRSTHAVRWDLDNSKVLCMGCHKFWWHKYSPEALAWWEKEIGGARMASLALRANGKGGKPNLVAVRAYLIQEGRKYGLKLGGV